MKVAVVKERRAFERRVAASPDSVKHMVGMGLEVAVETGAGDGAFFVDAAYQAAGATMAADAKAALGGADIVLKVQRPLVGKGNQLNELKMIKPGAVLIGMLAPLEHAA
jgi:NAD(P) transhydrogenase subunit alpha